MKMKSNQGLTLIELAVALLIVGILAAIAIPNYTSYMIRGRRSDAKTALEQLRAAQEMIRAERGGYSTSLTQLVTTFGVQNTAGDYTILLSAATGTTFTGEARPATPRQTSDGSLFINQNGRKWDADGNAYPQGKWAK